MQCRRFGRTDWQVSEIGHGTWTMGGMWGPVDEAEAVRSLRHAIERGVNFIDTALVYGEGRSEQLIAKALETVKTPVYLATKVPPKDEQWPARHKTPLAKAFPSEWITACTEKSLSHLRREQVDLQQLHVWAPRWLKEQDAWLPAVDRLKREGKIRAFGISVNDFEPETAEELVSSGLIDSIQVIYNIFEQAPAQTLLPLCQRHDVGVIVRVPFDEGGLTGALTEETVFHPDDWRSDYFQGKRLQETVQRVDRLQFLVRGEIKTMAQAALKFCLSHPAVSTVIPGMRTIQHVEENCRVSDGRGLKPQELATLAEHAWPRNFYV